MCSAETLCWKHSLLCPVAKCFSFHHQLPSVSKRCKDIGAEGIKGRPCITISFWSVSLSDQLIMSLAMLSREDFSQYLSHTFSLWSIFPPVCRLFVCCGRSSRSMEPLLCFFYLVKDRKTEQTMSEKGRFSPWAQTFKIKDEIKSKGWVSSFLDSLLSCRKLVVVRTLVLETWRLAPILSSAASDRWTAELSLPLPPQLRATHEELYNHDNVSLLGEGFEAGWETRLNSSPQRK